MEVCKSLSPLERLVTSEEPSTETLDVRGLYLFISESGWVYTPVPEQNSETGGVDFRDV